MGVKVKIMKPYDATGKFGVSHPLPDVIEIEEPKEEKEDEIRVEE